MLPLSHEGENTMTIQELMRLSEMLEAMNNNGLIVEDVPREEREELVLLTVKLLHSQETTWPQVRAAWYHVHQEHRYMKLEEGAA
jgi:hypothetical protein